MPRSKAQTGVGGNGRFANTYSKGGPLQLILHVDPDAPSPGDGSEAFPYAAIDDAFAEVLRVATSGLVVNVVVYFRGVNTSTTGLLISQPGISLRLEGLGNGATITGAIAPLIWIEQATAAEIVNCTINGTLGTTLVVEPPAAVATTVRVDIRNCVLGGAAGLVGLHVRDSTGIGTAQATVKDTRINGFARLDLDKFGADPSFVDMDDVELQGGPGTLTVQTAGGVVQPRGERPVVRLRNMHYGVDSGFVIATALGGNSPGLVEFDGYQVAEDDGVTNGLPTISFAPGLPPTITGSTEMFMCSPAFDLVAGVYTPLYTGVEKAAIVTEAGVVITSGAPNNASTVEFAKGAAGAALTSALSVDAVAVEGLVSVENGDGTFVAAGAQTVLSGELGGIRIGTASVAAAAATAFMRVIMFDIQTVT